MLNCGVISWKLLQVYSSFACHPTSLYKLGILIFVHDYGGSAFIHIGFHGYNVQYVLRLHEILMNLNILTNIYQTTRWKKTEQV